MIPVQHIHPMIVHFPIVLMFTLAAIDLTATLRGASVTGRSAVGSISTGIAVAAGILALGAWYFGGQALDFAEAAGFHSDIAETHEGLGEFTAFAFLGYAVIRSFLWLRDIRLNGAFGKIVPAIAVVGCMLVATTAYYGGQLVYELGVNVKKVASIG